MLKIHFQRSPPKIVFVVINSNISFIPLKPRTEVDVSQSISWLGCSRLWVARPTLHFPLSPYVKKLIPEVLFLLCSLRESPVHPIQRILAFEILAPFIRRRPFLVLTIGMPLLSFSLDAENSLCILPSQFKLFKRVPDVL
jgi:hypothetical protein